MRLASLGAGDDVLPGLLWVELHIVGPAGPRRERRKNHIHGDERARAGRGGGVQNG